MPKRGTCAFRAVYVGIVWISSCLWLIENQLKYWATLKLPKQYIRGNTQRMSSNNEMPLWSTGFCHLRFQHFSLKFRWQNPVDERRSSATCPKRIWTQWCWSARNGTVRRRSYVSLVLAHDSKTVPAPSERTTGLSSCCYCNIGDPWLRILHPMDPGYGKIVSINWNRLSQGILQHPGIKKIILYDPYTNNTWDNYRTRVRSLAMLVSNSLTDSLTHSLLFSKLDWCDVWLVKMPTQNLLSLLLLLMLMMRNVLTTVLCSFGSWSLVIKLNFVQTLSTRFGQEFEVEVQAKLLKLKFGQYFAAEAWWGYEVNVWSRFWC